MIKITKTTKYLMFRLFETKSKTEVYEVLSRNYSFTLGFIKWFGRWRKYCFFPDEDTVFDNKCMDEISRFCIELNEDYKKLKEDENRTKA